MLGGVDRLLEKAQVPIAEVRGIVHGMTLVTNAVLERKGGPAGPAYTSQRLCFGNFAARYSI